MKKIVGLALGMILTVFTYAQDVTFTDAGSNYDKASATSFNFTLDASFTSDKIANSSTYYTDYFTVTPTDNANGHDLVITLVENTDMNRRIITRFFVTMEVINVNVNGSALPLDDFMQTYIMN